jgi:glucose dehydrogenase
VNIVGHAESVFRTDGNVLFFASFPTFTQGCTVFAYDLTTGKKMWETKLNAVPKVGHTAYRNQVTMELSSFAELGKEGEGAIKIVGRESFGDYVEVLDRATGKVLAHKVYRQGF